MLKITCELQTISSKIAGSKTANFLNMNLRGTFLEFCLNFYDLV